MGSVPLRLRRRRRSSAAWNVIIGALVISLLVFAASLFQVAASLRQPVHAPMRVVFVERR